MDLKEFDKYIKSDKAEANSNKEIWMYTRVSSKEQFTNYSIEDQIRSIKEYAKQHGFVITQQHGGTYESAKGDHLTRKEFMILYNNVLVAKHKPFGIAIKFLSRFSRSGGSAIGLVEELVTKMGVHLIETSSGLTTENERDRITIYDKLLESRKENIQRLERTLPAMKDFLAEGKWLGKPPRGYTMYGKRVTNANNRRYDGQKIEINEEGEILKKAWNWKAEGMADVDIRYKLLDKYHFKISKQNISAMWRKPFYVGILTHKMLGKSVKGNWPPLISMKIWDKVQDRLDSSTRKAGYEKAPVNEHRPLTGFIYCSECGAPITSYIAKKKQVHYYKCQHGAGGNMNAYTTPRSLKPGVNDSFIDFLANLELDEYDRELLSNQILELTHEHQLEKKASSESLKKELIKLQNKLDKVNDKFFMSDSADETAYNRVKRKLENEIKSVEEKLEDAPQNLSNQENLLIKALNFCQSMSNHWASGDIHQKIKIQKTLFPEGLVINPETRQYRTNKMNRLISVIAEIARDDKDSKNKKTTRRGGLSSIVAGTGLEPVTFGL
ncbi:recombinase family protein [Salinimicrobium profundisediminis]|uniref:recombinase family protein n=1 Tax=Salinimicrobium profundisediminis TaxID=2994553 RepID=UPI003522A1B0